MPLFVIFLIFNFFFFLVCFVELDAWNFMVGYVKFLLKFTFYLPAFKSLAKFSKKPHYQYKSTIFYIVSTSLFL